MTNQPKYISEIKGGRQEAHFYRVWYNNQGKEERREPVDDKAIKKWWDNLSLDERIERLQAASRAGYKNPCMMEAWEVREKDVLPSEFTVYPWSSLVQNSEKETIARNIMIILSRTGNKFRPLDWEEYHAERECDGGPEDHTEKIYFNAVIDYCKSADTARLFSESWNVEK